MRLEEWDRILNADPEYRREVQEIAFAQTIADDVVRKRVQVGMSQAQLARRAGTSQAAISKLECGDGNPTISKVARVLAILREELEKSKAPAVEMAVIRAPTAAMITATGEWVIPKMINLSPGTRQVAQDPAYQPV